MINFLNKFRIPTLLGLGIILAGMGAGIYLVFQNQTISSQAAANVTAQNITFTNIIEDSAVISWQTASPANSFITFGQNNPTEQTALDDRDATAPRPHFTHIVTLKNLFPKTTYQLKINSGKISSDILRFTTTSPVNQQTGFTPIIGSVLDGNKPLDEGLGYLSIVGANTQATLIKNGNFLIPLSYIRKEDLSDTYQLSPDTLAKLTIVSNNSQASALFYLKLAQNPLPPIKLGENVDLTIPSETPSPSPITNLDKYDLNKDGKINSADYALVIKNKVDLNGDGKVDQKDLDLMSKQINQ